MRQAHVYGGLELIVVNERYGKALACAAASPLSCISCTGAACVRYLARGRWWFVPTLQRGSASTAAESVRNVFVSSIFSFEYRF